MMNMTKLQSSQYDRPFPKAKCENCRTAVATATRRNLPIQADSIPWRYKTAMLLHHYGYNAYRTFGSTG